MFLNSNYPGSFQNVNRQPMGFQNSMSPFQMFVSMFKQTSQCTPEETVKQMLQDGRMTNEQFQQLSQMANMIMGSNK